MKEGSNSEFTLDPIIIKEMFALSLAIFENSLYLGLKEGSIIQIDLINLQNLSQTTEIVIQNKIATEGGIPELLAVENN